MAYKIVASHCWLASQGDCIRMMTDDQLATFLSGVFCAGMSAQERGDDFHHAFPWTLDKLREPPEETSK
ncbi:MAG: hypothetical protein VB053_03375 [Oscillibacter ruminantium]|uniref:hypothetical protein n=1 Tax=Oscillibacter ruminantium TaxID=1263547 RepID=UPI002B1F66D0|nr:hypothetical protein [Oscillibacter ruminantium]MEA5041565.1 hypothetical protein [Oscillibacter ruminantium]